MPRLIFSGKHNAALRSVHPVSSGLFLIGPAPGNDGDAALVAPLVRRCLQDPVPPQHVDVACKHVGGSVGLRHRDNRLKKKKKKITARWLLFTLGRDSNQTLSDQPTHTQE